MAYSIPLHVLLQLPFFSATAIVGTRRERKSVGFNVSNGFSPFR
jgi:hypothetical protein